MFGRKEIKLKIIYNIDRGDVAESVDYLYYNEYMIINYSDNTFCYFEEYRKHCYNKYFFYEDFNGRQKVYYICG